LWKKVINCNERSGNEIKRVSEWIVVNCKHAFVPKIWRKKLGASGLKTCSFFTSVAMPK
jgi:hypothetical protein